MTLSLSPAGDRAWLAMWNEVDPRALHRLASALRTTPEIVAATVGERSLYVIGNRHLDASEVRRLLETNHETEAAAAPRLHRIEVNFSEENGPDLAELVARVGGTRESFLRELAALHLSAHYLGFRAGFAYLGDWPAHWAIPRRRTSRDRVPGGTFAVAGLRAGFYPVDSPGGWNLLGRSDAALWDADRDPPNLIHAGDAIEIVPVDRPLAFASRAPHESLDHDVVAEVLQTGQASIVVRGADWSRIELGLPPSGPFDPEAAAFANAFAGNAADAPLLECVMVGPQLRFAHAARASWIGASAEITIDGRAVSDPRRFEIAAGAVVSIGRLRDGLRGWLAVSGGVDIARVRHPEVPPRLIKGAALHAADSERVAPRWPPTLQRGDAHELTAIAGPHPVDRALLEALAHAEWNVTPQLDRIGIRLRAASPPAFTPPADLPSCGMQFGSVQWHPDGSLVVMGPDHPVTGGYLQPFTVVSTERWKLAQLAPGTRIRFRLA